MVGAREWKGAHQRKRKPRKGLNHVAGGNIENTCKYKTCQCAKVAFRLTNSEVHYTIDKATLEAATSRGYDRAYLC